MATLQKVADVDPAQLIQRAIDMRTMISDNAAETEKK